MSGLVIDLNSILVSTLFLTPGSLEDVARELYHKQYCGVTHHRTHDGQEVKFFADRFSHAFFTSLDSSGHGHKARIDAERVARIMWIRELIPGRVATSECILVPSERPGRAANRLYVINSELFVVWLEPQKAGWKFSSAYKPLASQIKKYRARGKTIWKYGWK